MPWRTKQNGTANSLRVLIVEDDELLRKLLVSVLTQTGYQVSTADSVETAKRVLAEVGHKFDVAVLDCRLPEANGMELARLLEVSRSADRVLMITGLDPDWVVQKMDGITIPWRLLLKPFKGSRLVEEIQDFIR